MNEVITIGVDLAKNVYQVHGVDAAGANSGANFPPQLSGSSASASRPRSLSR